jgi:hypothetical protein
VNLHTHMAILSAPQCARLAGGFRVKGFGIA